MGAALLTIGLTVLLWPVAAGLRRRHGIATPPPREVSCVRGASVLAVVGLALWGWVVSLLESLGDTTVLLPAAQAVLGLAAVGGLGAALWRARAALQSGDGWAKALALAWVLAFAVLLVVGVHHHLIDFNQNY